MSKIYKATHKQWGSEEYGDTAREAAGRVGCEIEDPELVITEIEKTDYLLSKVPVEFRGKLGYMAYEQGHSAGQDEVELILDGLVSDLAPVIEKYTKRILGEKKEAA